MVCRPGIMMEIHREAMNHYWSVVYSKTDDGLDATELKWKRQHERDMKRMADKWDKAFNEEMRHA